MEVEDIGVTLGKEKKERNDVKLLLMMLMMLNDVK